MKNLSILGSTGSIGTNTLDVVRKFSDRFSVTALSVNSSTEVLLKQIKEFKPKFAVIADKRAYDNFDKSLVPETNILFGDEGLKTICILDDVDLVVNALVGFAGLKPTIAAINKKKNIALANKETLVVAGEIVLSEVNKNQTHLIPIDSEHSALYFLLQKVDMKKVHKLVLTASGGPFRNLKKEDLKNVTVEQALKHPNWDMGAKITIDSATMMNKGFEVIEAYHFFDVPYSSIDVIVHPESIIHSMIETIDGEFYAQLGPTDMRYPIQNALSYPDVLSTPFDRMDLSTISGLTFKKPDWDAFPLLRTAYEVGEKKGTYPAVLNASNEIAVASFIKKELSFLGIYELIKACLDAHDNKDKPGLEDIFEADKWAREYALKLITKGF
jgi:1-deoxy-D-xylulose-5-phosphate reductoisomerase